VGRSCGRRRKNKGANEEEQQWYCHLRFCVSFKNTVFRSVLVLQSVEIRYSRCLKKIFWVGLDRFLSYSRVVVRVFSVKDKVVCERTQKGAPIQVPIMTCLISLFGQLTRNSISSGTIQQAMDLTIPSNGDHIVWRKVLYATSSSWETGYCVMSDDRHCVVKHFVCSNIINSVP
jgi:hypothetical protein